VLNSTPRHEDVLGSGGIAPCILDLGTRWGDWSSSRSGRFIPRERATGTHWIGGGWAPEPFWTRWWGEKFSAPAGNQKCSIYACYNAILLNVWETISSFI